MMPNTNKNCYIPCPKDIVEQGQCGCHVRAMNNQMDWLPHNRVKQEARELYFSFYTLTANTPQPEWRARQMALLCVNRILNVIEDEREEGFNWREFYGKVHELLSNENYIPFD